MDHWRIVDGPNRDGDLDGEEAWTTVLENLKRPESRHTVRVIISGTAIASDPATLPPDVQSALASEARTCVEAVLKVVWPPDKIYVASDGIRAEHDPVTIALPHGNVELSWEARDLLLREIRHLPSAANIVSAFEAVGATRPVTLGDEERGKLHGLIDEWARNAGSDNLPADVRALRSALAYE